jgi:hypothetical protein
VITNPYNQSGSKFEKMAKDKLQKETATKINGQPTDHNVTQLKKELITIAATILTELGGRNHGHAGLIINPTQYLTMTGITAFTVPANPGIYPTMLASNAATETRARAEAEHKELQNQFEKLQGMEQGLKDIIIKAVESDFLLKIEDKTIGFLNVSARQMITHLCNRGGTLDFADTKTLLAKKDQEWDVSKAPTIYFNQVEKAIKQLNCTGITSRHGSV